MLQQVGDHIDIICCTAPLDAVEDKLFLLIIAGSDPFLNVLFGAILLHRLY